MKKIFILMSIIGLVSFSCEQTLPGPQGASGLNGADGLDGLNGEESFVFEYELSFTAPNYDVRLNLPNDFVMLDSDVMLAFFLWEIRDGIEIWRSLPQTLYFQDGVLHYNYDFTKNYADIFLDGTVDLDGLGADYTDNWIARVVVVPGQFANGRTSTDLSDYNDVKELFNLSSSQFKTENYNPRPI